MNDTKINTDENPARRARPSSWHHLPILALTAVRGGRSETTDIYNDFAPFPDFSPADLAPYKHQPNQPIWQQNVRLAQQQLKARGNMTFSRADGWAITAQGLKRLAEGLDASDESLLALEKIGITFDQIRNTMDSISPVEPVS